LPRFSWRLIPVALLVLSPGPAPAETGAKPTKVTLTYTHMDNVVAGVQWRSRQTATAPWPADTINHMTYEAYNVPVADGFVTRDRNLRVWRELPGQPGRIDEVGSAFGTRFAQIARSAEPVISRDGSLVRIAGLSGAVAQMRALFGRMAQDLPPQRRRQFEDFIESEINEKQFTATAMTYWHQSVGVWNGMTLEKGVALESEATTPCPMLGAAEIPVRHRIKFIDWTPCHAQDKDQSCVSLEMRTVMDAKKRQAALRDFSQRISRNRGAKMTFESLDYEVLVKLIAEPRTLRVHRFDVSTAMAMVLSDAHGASESSRTKHESVLVTYRSE
jgi:hypothetical protein